MCYDDDDLPPGSTLMNCYHEHFENLNINYFVCGWKIAHMITIININKLPFGLNWKSKLNILCSENSLPMFCIKHEYQHCDEPNTIDIYVFNHFIKHMFKTVLQNYVNKHNIDIKII